MGWPVMKAGVSGVGEFVLHATANIGDQATFDQSGRANGHRPYVAYWLMLEGLLVSWLCRSIMNLATGKGATAQPIRQPVMA